MLRLYGLLLILTLLSPVPSQGAKAKPTLVDSLIATASDSSLSFKTREANLKEALAYDQSGKVMFALAGLHYGKGSGSGRQTGKKWIKRAIAREKENANYVGTYAGMIWQAGGTITPRRRASYKKAREALELDPNCVEALYWAGRFVAWSWEMTFFTEGDDYDKPNYRDDSAIVGRTYVQRGYADLDVETGIDFFTRALETDPHHWPSRMHLGLVYHMAQRPRELVALFSDYLKIAPNSRDGYFFRGLGYQMQGKLQRAYEAYVEALDRMDEPERRFMQSIFMIRDKKEEEKGVPLPDPSDITRFWFGRDPLFLTDINERLLEQCRRVAYVNLRFGDPRGGLEGWQSDRGQAYIRYGDPIARGMVAANIDLGLDKTLDEQKEMARNAGTSGALYKFTPRIEKWSYDGFDVRFENTNTWDSWRFGTASLGYLELSFADLVKVVPDYYKYLYQYDVPYQSAQFRGEDGETRVEVYYALEGEKVVNQELTPGVRKVDVKQALFLFGSEWDTLKQEVGRLSRMPWVTYESTRAGYLFAGEQLTLDPGSYYLAAEAEDQKSKMVGTFRDSLHVRRFDPDSLQISSLLMARRIVEKDEGVYGRQRFLILPNPLKQCSRDGQATFYFEIYNLKQDQFGATHYEVSYQMQVLPEKGVNTTSVPDWTTAVSYDYQGSRDWETYRLTLKMNESTPGIRAFRVSVRDLQSNEEVEGTTAFRVKW
jgi:GWxTD domain-containing protein